MNQPEQKVDVFCNNCGQTFSTFLRQMADHNQRVVCPLCGHQHEAAAIHGTSPGAAKPNDA